MRNEVPGPDDTVPLTKEGPRTAGVDRLRVALAVYHRDGAEVATLVEGRSIVVGRAAPADLCVPDGSLSRRHARFSLQGGAVTVEDLQSTNGTVLRGVRVDAGTLVPGDEVILGEVVVTIEVLAGGRPRPKGLDGHERLIAALEDELARARHQRRQVGLLLVGTAAEPRWHVGRFLTQVLDRLRPMDRAGLYSADTLEVLLAETSADEATDLARSVLASEPSLIAGLAVFPGAGSTAGALLDAARGALLAASAGERLVCVGGATITPPAGAAPAGGPLVESRAMHTLFETLGRVAPTAVPVLLRGETGVGKEVVARALHERGPRGGKPIVFVNCGAIPASLVESTLFGHEKGSFTGAAAQHKGVFEAADGGTVLLDEIGELPAPAQAALLRVLETRKITRVGSTKEIDVDVRVVAATHRDLEEMSAAGTFREDLFYRLNVVALRVPPLRERVEEIAPLAELFVERAAHAFNRQMACALTRDVVAALEAYRWPGNVRELKNAMDRAVVIARTGTITLEDLPDCVKNEVQPFVAERTGGVSTTTSEAVPVGGSADAAAAYKESMRRYEARLILETLERCGGVQTQAAVTLGMPIRTLAHRMKLLGIRRGKTGFVVAEHADDDA